MCLSNARCSFTKEKASRQRDCCKNFCTTWAHEGKIKNIVRWNWTFKRLMISCPGPFLETACVTMASRGKWWCLSWNVSKQYHTGWWSMAFEQISLPQLKVCARVTLFLHTCKSYVAKPWQNLYSTSQTWNLTTSLQQAKDRLHPSTPVCGWHINLHPSKRNSC